MDLTWFDQHEFNNIDIFHQHKTPKQLNLANQIFVRHVFCIVMCKMLYHMVFTLTMMMWYTIHMYILIFIGKRFLNIVQRLRQCWWINQEESPRIPWWSVSQLTMAGHKVAKQWDLRNWRKPWFLEWYPKVSFPHYFSTCATFYDFISFLRNPDIERFPQDLPIWEILCVFLAGAVSAGDPDNSSGSLCVILNITSVVSFGDDIPFLLLGDMNK